jgi:hypothetical protein
MYNPQLRISWDRLLDFFSFQDQISGGSFISSVSSSHSSNFPLINPAGPNLYSYSVSSDRTHTIESSKASIRGPEPDEENIRRVNREIMKRRNKVVYLANVSAAIIDLNLNEYSLITAYLIEKFKLAQNSKLRGILYQGEYAELKASIKMWEEYRVFDDKEVILRVLEQERVILENNTRKLREVILQENEVRLLRLV